MIDKFKKIEWEYPVESVYVDEDQVWSYLRIIYYWKSIESVTSEYAKTKKTSKWKQVGKKLKEMLYGFSNWFRGYDYLIFSAFQRKKVLGDKYIDQSFEYIENILGSKRCLYIDDVNKELEYIPYKHIVSHSVIEGIRWLLSRLYYMVNRSKVKIDVFDDINRLENINVDYTLRIKQYKVEKFIYKTLLKIYQPKVIFINCYYCKPALVKAANDLGIQTVEMQHGLIGKEHFAYNIGKKLDKIFFPNHLLVFGEYDRQMICHNEYVPFETVYPVGSFFLEKHKRIDAPLMLQKELERYSITVSISTAYTVEKELANFIIPIAHQYKDIGFFFSLRGYKKDYYKKFDLVDNIHLIDREFDCYTLMKACDYHTTVYSTCAFEATFFEKVSILVDINGYASKYIDYRKSSNMILVNSQDEYIAALEKKYKEEENVFYASDYEKNVSRFLKKIIDEENK